MSEKWLKKYLKDMRLAALFKREIGCENGLSEIRILERGDMERRHGDMARTPVLGQVILFLPPKLHRFS